MRSCFPSPSLLERLGDVLHHVVPFLQASWMCRLDQAVTNRDDRDLNWLPTLRCFTSPSFSLSVLGRLSADDSLCRYRVAKCGKCGNCPRCAASLKWLAAFRWIHKRLPMPRKLICRSILHADEAFACLSGCKTASNIHELDISESSYTTAQGLRFIQNCSLRRLNLSYCSLDDDVWRLLGEEKWQCFQSLLHLTLNDRTISAFCTHVLSKNCTSLEEIVIEPGDDSVMESLSTGTLQILQISSCTSISQNAFVNLDRLTSLRKLVVKRCAFSDEALEHITRIKSLRELVFTKSSSLTIRGVALIAERLTTLTRLELHHCCDLITDECVEVICRNLLTLEHLTLHAYSDSIVLTSASVTQIGLSLTQLKSLDLSGTTILQGDRGKSCLEHLLALTRLRELKINYTQLPDSAVAVLEQLTRLNVCVELFGSIKSCE